MSLHRPMKAPLTSDPSASANGRSPKDRNLPQKPALSVLAAAAGWSFGPSKGRGSPTETLLRTHVFSATQILAPGRVQITGVSGSHLEDSRQGLFLACMVSLFSIVALYMPYLGPKSV
jgi:hypothetical protein